MTNELVQKTPSDFDRFDFFWSEYMVWSLRLVIYSANEYFFFSIRESLMSVLPSWGISIVILVYSIVSLRFIETSFSRRYNPAYEHLQLSSHQRSYRVGRERLLYSGLLYCCINMALGYSVSVILSPQNQYLQYTPFESIGIGLMGIIVSFLGVFFGVLFMTGRFGEAEKRVPLLYPLGFAGFLVPTLFVLYSIRHFFFYSSGSW